MTENPPRDSQTTVRERADEMIAWCRAWPDNVSGLELTLLAEIERLRRIEQCVRYLVNSDAWVGDTDGIEANLDELKELLNG